MTAVHIIVLLLSTMRQPYRPDEAHDSKQWTAVCGACLGRKMGGTLAVSYPGRRGRINKVNTLRERYA